MGTISGPPIELIEHSHSTKMCRKITIFHNNQEQQNTWLNHNRSPKKGYQQGSNVLIYPTFHFTSDCHPMTGVFRRHLAVGKRPRCYPYRRGIEPVVCRRDIRRWPTRLLGAGRRGGGLNSRIGPDWLVPPPAMIITERVQVMTPNLIWGVHIGSASHET